jgi:hypothetical protein
MSSPLRINASEYNYWPGPQLDSFYWELYVEDFDLDGRNDLLFRYKGDPSASGLAVSDTLFYLAMNSGSSFDLEYAFVIGESTPGLMYDDYELYLGDINGDGYPDIVGRKKIAGAARFLVGVFHPDCFGDTDGVPSCRFEDMGEYGWGAGTAPNISFPNWELLLEDVDGDGLSDLLGRNEVMDSDTLFWMGLSEIDAGGDFLNGDTLILEAATGAWLYYEDWEIYPFDYDGTDGIDFVARERSDTTSIKIVPSAGGGFYYTLATFSPFYVGSDSGIYNLDPAHFDLVVGDATGDGKADLVSRQKTWVRSRHYVAEQLGDVYDTRFMAGEADTLGWWNVPSEYRNRVGWEYYYGDFTGDGKLDILAWSGGIPFIYHVAESSCDTVKCTRDFLAAEPWRYVAVEGDEELLNSNYMDSIYIVDNVILLKGIECQIGQIRSDMNRTITFRTRDNVEICSVEFSFSVSDLAPVREYPNNITLENENLVMSAKADGSFWFFLKTVDDVVNINDPVEYDYRKYIQRTNRGISDTTSYIHLNDEMGYGFFTYDVFGSFDTDSSKTSWITDVDSENPKMKTTQNAAFIVNVFPAGKQINRKLLKNRFMVVHPTQLRNEHYPTPCDSGTLKLPSLKTVHLWADSLITTDLVGCEYDVGVNSLLLFEDIWIRKPFPDHGSPAPYEECEKVYNLSVGDSLAEHIMKYKAVPGIDNVVIYTSARQAFNDLYSRSDSSSAELFIAEIGRLWGMYHEDITEGLGIDGIYIDLFPGTFYREPVHLEKDAPIRLSYEIVRGVRRIIGEENILFVHSTINPVHGLHSSPAPYEEGYYKDISANRNVYAPFLDVYADYILRGEHGPMFDSAMIFLDDDSTFINDHIHYVCYTRNRSNTVGIAKLSPHPDFPNNWGDSHEWIDAFNPIQKDRRSPIPPFRIHLDSIADLQARYFDTYLKDGSMMLWKGARKSLTEYRDDLGDFFPRYVADDDSTYETQFLNFWRWLVGPKRQQPNHY